MSLPGPPIGENHDRDRKVFVETAMELFEPPDELFVQRQYDYICILWAILADTENPSAAKVAHEQLVSHIIPAHSEV